MNTASSTPSWYPSECAAIDYCANVEHVFWVSRRRASSSSEHYVAAWHGHYSERVHCGCVPRQTHARLYAFRSLRRFGSHLPPSAHNGALADLTASERRWTSFAVHVTASRIPSRNALNMAGARATRFYAAGVISAVFAVSATNPVNPQLHISLRCRDWSKRADSDRWPCSGQVSRGATSPCASSSGIALRVNISIFRVKSRCEPSYRYPKLRGINHDVHPARFWLALVPCAVAGALAIGIAISARANLACFSCCGRRSIVLSIRQFVCKRRSVQPPSDHLDTKPHETVRSAAARWL